MQITTVIVETKGRQFQALLTSYRISHILFFMARIVCMTKERITECRDSLRNPPQKEILPLPTGKYFLNHPVYRYVWLIMAICMFMGGCFLISEMDWKNLFQISRNNILEDLFLCLIFLFFSGFSFFLSIMGIHEFLSNIAFKEDSITVFFLFRKKTIILDDIIFFRYTPGQYSEYFFKIKVATQYEFFFIGSSRKVKTIMSKYMIGKKLIMFGRYIAKEKLNSIPAFDGHLF